MSFGDQLRELVKQKEATWMEKWKDEFFEMIKSKCITNAKEKGSLITNIVITKVFYYPNNLLDVDKEKAITSELKKLGFSSVVVYFDKRTGYLNITLYA